MHQHVPLSPATIMLNICIILRNGMQLEYQLKITSKVVTEIHKLFP